MQQMNNQFNPMNPMMNQMSPNPMMGNNNQQPGFNMPNIAAGNQYTDPNNFMSFNFTQGTIGFDIAYENPIIFNFKLFESTPYHGRDLIFLDQTISFMDLDDKISYLTFLSNKRIIITIN
jgi:hypothetical protein